MSTEHATQGGSVGCPEMHRVTPPFICNLESSGSSLLPVAETAVSSLAHRRRSLKWKTYIRAPLSADDALLLLSTKNMVMDLILALLFNNTTRRTVLKVVSTLGVDVANDDVVVVVVVVASVMMTLTYCRLT